MSVLTTPDDCVFENDIVSPLTVSATVKLAPLVENATVINERAVTLVADALVDIAHFPEAPAAAQFAPLA